MSDRKSGARKKRTVYQRIMDADSRDAGLRLSADDVALLADDEMISARAAVDDEGQGQIKA